MLLHDNYVLYVDTSFKVKTFCGIIAPLTNDSYDCNHVTIANEQLTDYIASGKISDHPSSRSV